MNKRKRKGKEQSHNVGFLATFHVLGLLDFSPVLLLYSPAAALCSLHRLTSGMGSVVCSAAADVGAVGVGTGDFQLAPLIESKHVGPLKLME